MESPVLELNVAEGGNPVPVVGMVFESVEVAYTFYNDYAKRTGFGVRIKNSTKVKGTHKKRYSLFVCSREGFKEDDHKVKYVKPTIRVGCMARVRVKQKEMKYQATEVILEHNHELTPSLVGYYRSHKKLDSGAKRKLLVEAQVRDKTNKSSQSVTVDAGDYEILEYWEKEASDPIHKTRSLNLKEGDAQALFQYFRPKHQEYSRFFFTIEVDNETCLRHVFWVDPRSKVAYEYFGDVVMFDTTYLMDNYNLNCISFVGLNHHGQSVLFGCGLIADATMESFIWLFNVFLEAMGHPPSAIITDHCQAIQGAVNEVFPNTNHHICLSHIMKKVPEKLGSIREYETIQSTLKNIVYDTLKSDDFEKKWKNMIKEFKLADNEWLNTLYDIRQLWLPVFVKESFNAGMSTTRYNENVAAFFEGHVKHKTCLKDFIIQYELALEKKWQKEEKADFDSFNTSPVMKTFSSYEVQLAEVYTREIFAKFQEELIGMSCCSSIRLVTEEGAIATYIVKQNSYRKDGLSFPLREYDVVLNKAQIEVHCVCCLFEHKGYLCRHALYVLNFNEVIEIPPRYILPRWRKDFKFVQFRDCELVDTKSSDKRARYTDLFRKFTKLAEEGEISDQGYRVALKMYYESLKNIRYANKQVQSDSYKHLITEESHSCGPNMSTHGSGFGDTTMEDTSVEPTSVLCVRLGSLPVSQVSSSDAPSMAK